MFFNRSAFLSRGKCIGIVLTNGESYKITQNGPNEVCLCLLVCL